MQASWIVRVEFSGNVRERVGNFLKLATSSRRVAGNDLLRCDFDRYSGPVRDPFLDLFSVFLGVHRSLRETVDFQLENLVLSRLPRQILFEGRRSTDLC